MRLISFINAALVIVALYFLVFERDTLFAFAGRGDAETGIRAGNAPGHVSLDS